MARRGTVAVVGSLHQDLHLQVGHLPDPGETVVADRWHRGPGGKGANQAVACAAGGATTVMLGAVGQDLAGEAVLSALRGAGVDVAVVDRLAGRETSTAVVVVDDDGVNSILVAPDASGALPPAVVTSHLDAVPALRVVLTQAEVPPSVVTAAAVGAATSGARLVHNLAPYRPVEEVLLAQCDPLVVN